jgi:tetratricopeptide (TPR) repeat protein
MRLVAPLLFSCLAVVAIASPMKPAAPSQPGKKLLAHKAARPVLDELFARLAKAQSQRDAEPIENQIFQLFEASGSPTVDLLMARATAATTGGDNDTAKKLFVSVTDIAPKYAEGWHARAQLEQQDGNDEAAMLALQKTITLNPRQFAAMAELGDMLEDYGNKAGALKMYRRALALDPNLEGGQKKLRQLERDVEGQGI